MQALKQEYRQNRDTFCGNDGTDSEQSVGELSNDL